MKGECGLGGAVECSWSCNGYAESLHSPISGKWLGFWFAGCHRFWMTPIICIENNTSICDLMQNSLMTVEPLWNRVSGGRS